MREPGNEEQPRTTPPPLRRNRDFLLLWTGQVASTVGTRASSVAFPLLVLALTGSPAKAGLVAFAQTLPFPLLFLVAGVVVDRVDRKRLLLVADAECWEQEHLPEERVVRLLGTLLGSFVRTERSRGYLLSLSDEERQRALARLSPEARALGAALVYCTLRPSATWRDYLFEWQPALVVEMADRPLDVPAVAAESRAMLSLATRDHRLDPPLPELAAVLVVVVATIGDQPLGTPTRTANRAAYRRHRVNKRQQLRDVVAVRGRR